ncbi:MAG TPA: GNVR domain-containing protein [Myxococcaceae bacterium]|jgi:tyrosine-protein kinase Etk/Wzc
MTTKPEDEAPLTLRELAVTLREGRLLLAAGVAGALALGALSVLGSDAVYRATGLLQIEQRSKVLDPLTEDRDGYPVEIPSEAEIDIIRSNSIVLEAVQVLHLDISARPRRPPVIGRLLGSRQAIQVASLEVPPRLLDQPLTLIAGEAGTYTLLAPDGAPLLEGQVGTIASSGESSALVAGLFAKRGERFRVIKDSPASAVERFLSRLSVTEKGRNTGVIALELQGPDPDRVQAELAALMEIYLSRNVDRRTRSAERRLEFVNGQLPVLKENLEAAELRLKQYRARTGQLDVGLQSKAIIDRGQEINNQITLLQLQLSDLRQRFTESHPSMVALNAKLRRLAYARHVLNEKAEARPDTELTLVRLDRDVKVAGELYVHLLSKAQELAVWKAAGIGSVRLADPAFAYPRPVKPDGPATLVVSLLAGLSFGLVGALVRRGLHQGARGTAWLEKGLGLPVYACLPRSRRRSRAPLALAAPDDPFVEALRALRARLDHELEAAPNKVVLLTSSRPHRGTALVAANLSVLFAQAGRRVLLVDADLRKGPLGRHFPRARGSGLAALLEGQPLHALLSPSGVPNLHLLSSGGPAPAGLLDRPALARALELASASFDVVLCVAPPVLAASDAAVIGKAAFATLLVVKAGHHPVDELALAILRLDQCGARPSGFVVNAVRIHPGFQYP